MKLVPTSTDAMEQVLQPILLRPVARCASTPSNSMLAAGKFLPGNQRSKYCPMLYPLSYDPLRAGRIRTCNLRINDVTLIFTTGKTKTSLRLCRGTAGRGWSCSFESSFVNSEVTE